MRGAKDAGADDIVVVDSHGAGGDRNFNSVVPDLLEEGCRYFSQYRWFDFETLLREGCDAAIIVGMHAMAGTPDGVLAHTASYNTWVECRINDQPVGETAILAALCSHHGCPIAVVTGDEAACREAEELITPPPVTVAVKRGIGRFSAIHLHPEAAHRLIQEKTAQALRDVRSVGLYRPAEPCTVEVQFTSPEIAQGYLTIEEIEPAGPCGIKATGPTWRDAWRRIGW